MRKKYQTIDITNSMVPALLDMQYSAGLEIRREIFDSCISNEWYLAYIIAKDYVPACYLICVMTTPIEIIEVVTHPGYRRRGMAEFLLNKIGESVAAVPYEDGGSDDPQKYKAAQFLFRKCGYTGKLEDNLIVFTKN